MAMQDAIGATAERFVYSCRLRPGDNINGYVTPRAELAVEICTETAGGDLVGLDVILTPQDAAALGAWLTENFGSAS